MDGEGERVCFTEKFYVHHSFATRKYQTIKLQTTEVSFQGGSYALLHNLKMSIQYTGVTKLESALKMILVWFENSGKHYCGLWNYGK